MLVFRTILRPYLMGGSIGYPTNSLLNDWRKKGLVTTDAIDKFLFSIDLCVVVRTVEKMF